MTRRTVKAQLVFDFDALEPFVDAVDGDAAEQLGVSRRTVQRWRHGQRLTSLQADRAACHLGVNPVALWPDWHQRHDDAYRAELERRRSRSAA